MNQSERKEKRWDRAFPLYKKAIFSGAQIMVTKVMVRTRMRRM